jgi:hypothetical protein
MNIKINDERIIVKTPYKVFAFYIATAEFTRLVGNLQDSVVSNTVKGLSSHYRLI